MTPKETAAAMREMADVIERMPPRSMWHISALCWPREAEMFREIARTLGTFTKGDSEMRYEIIKTFGEHAKIQADIDRGKICKKVKVIKEVEEYACEDSLLDPLAVPQIVEGPISIFPKQ